MATNPEDPAPTGGADPVSQADIDAQMHGGGGEGTAPPGTPDGRSDTDAEPSVAATDRSASENGAATPPSGPRPGVNQGDIDAMIAGAEEPMAEGAEIPADGPIPHTNTGAADARLDSPGRPFDDAAAAMQASIEEERGASGGLPEAAAMNPEPVVLESFDGGSSPSADAKRVSMLGDVRLRVKVELGRTRMRVEEVLRLDEGSVVELNKLAGDPVDVLVNERLVARGEVLVLNDSFCVRINEVLTNDPHRISA